MLFPLIMLSLVCSVFSFSGLNSTSIGPSWVSAQTSDSSPNPNPIQILSTSTYSDDLDKFHIIGEVNNTSNQPQNNVVITAILSNTTNNILIGNYSAFTSINTLRTSELSPFDMIIQNPQQILGKFNFMEFIASSQPAIDEKPANLVLNGSSSFLDNTGNPHIIGNIINQGPNPEQFLNVVTTFYDNSSLGVIGTQSFGLNAGNLTQNQVAPFDITITDNKTKSQAAFYSLDVDSSQSSMSVPLNTKISFASTGGFAASSDSSLFNGLPVNNSPSQIANNNDDGASAIDNDDDEGNDDDDDDNTSDGDIRDDQRGEKKTDHQGNPWFNDKNCSEKPGSSGGSSSECEEAEREEESDVDDDSSEKDQGPSANSDSDSTNSDNDDDENENDNGDKNAKTNEDNSDGSNNGDNSEDNNN